MDADANNVIAVKIARNVYIKLADAVRIIAIGVPFGVVVFAFTALTASLLCPRCAPAVPLPVPLCELSWVGVAW